MGGQYSGNGEASGKEMNLFFRLGMLGELYNQIPFAQVLPLLCVALAAVAFADPQDFEDGKLRCKISSSKLHSSFFLSRASFIGCQRGFG